MLSPLQRQILDLFGGLLGAARLALAGGRRFSWEQQVALATERDGGFRRERFLEAVAAFDRLDPDEFELPASDSRQLCNEIHGWERQIDHRGQA